MAFISHCWKKNWRIETIKGFTASAWRALFLALTLCLDPINAQAITPVELQGLKIERIEQGVYLTANLQFEMPTLLEDAMLKGVSLYFVTEVDIVRERWYFYDKNVAHIERHVRLSYMPLTRRWRVSVSPQPFSAGGLGMNMGQSYDSLEDALVSVRRLVQWRVANATDLDADSKQNIELSFRLDLTQLPRPLQMGAAGQSDWNINLNRKQRLVMVSAP
jgi:hypothetical protein